MNSHVEDEPQIEGVDDEDEMPENESTCESRYEEPTNDDVCRVMQDDFKDHEEGRLRHILNSRCKNVVFANFGELQDRAKDNYY